MFGRRRLSGAPWLVLAALTLAVAACSPGQSNTNTGGGKIGGVVHVLGSWSGDEQASFLAMVKPFEDQTGVKVEYEGTRDLNGVLTTRVQAGNPPELAGLPGPGQMAGYAKAGNLVALDDIVDINKMSSEYSEDWIKLGRVDSSGQIGTGKLYSIFIKTALKGLVWYDPKNFSAKGYSEPTSWSDLTTLAGKIKSDGSSPWCITLESGSASGWPGSDWVKEIVLSQSGPDVYDQWWQGKLKWTSPQIKQAWQTFGEIINQGVYGGKQLMLSQNFGKVGDPMLASPPKCYMLNQGDFITSFFKTDVPSAQAGVDYKFFPLPDIDTANAGAHVVGGDLFGMFKSTPQSRALIKYLTTADAQAIWVKRGGALSPNKDVPLSDYPDDLSRSVAQTLVGAKTARFDAGDLMPADMQQAYWKGVLDFVSDQSKLDSILAHLDTVQADAYK